MIRLRRYRVFVACAVFTVLALYEFTSILHWSSTGGFDVQQTRLPDHPEAPRIPDEAGGFAKQPNPPSAGASDEEPQSGTTATAAESTELSALPETASATSLRSSSTADSTTPTSELLSHLETDAPAADPIPLRHDDEDLGGGEGRLEAPASASEPAVHWKRFPERYPVLEESAITLPTANPIAIPRIQHDSQHESAEHKAQRESRLAAVREAMNHTWTGYRDKAWMADEVRPISGGFRNPFCGWAATLVDSLDTLWIMGFEEQFEEAAKAVSQIDFTTTMRDDIPLFETTIRYLGGLLGAYDVSGGKHRNLLDKAVELADVLMGAFDTPNRMPVTFYRWKSQAASKPQRAESHAVLSELGSLSVEFTRLAQLTEEHRYYDAVARITNEFEAWQNHTRLPGLWPIVVDASGCRRVATPPGNDTSTGDDGTEKPLLPVGAAKDPAGSEGTSHQLGWGPEHRNRRRQLETVPTVNHTLDSPGGHSPETLRSQESQDAPVETHCEPQGFSSPSDTSIETFTLGGQSDSLYEYLPKEYLLLGGVEPKYRTMYEQAVKAIKKRLLFRPMTLYERDILHSGALSVYDGARRLLPEITHLTCFAGGMLGMAAKIFNRPDELELASKFAESCVWAYGSTQTGIMPEGFVTVACTDAANCEWNNTRYWEAIDPYHASREEQREKQLARQKAREAKTERRLRAHDAAGTAGPSQDAETREHEEEVRRANNLFKKLKRRRLGDDYEPPPPSSRELFLEGGPDRKQQDDGAATASLRAADQDPATSIGGSSESPNPTALDTGSEDEDEDEDEYLDLLPLPPTHEDYVTSRIEEERMPPGFVNFQSKKYILRPEAIESVFYMYRITGDVAWQEKGWRMFESIQKYTRTRLAYSAIDDVTSHVPFLRDEMESFWSAETLKYFFLLFSEVDVLSLDEWVLNTEAHPFKRPQPQPESPPPLQPPVAL